MTRTLAFVLSGGGARGALQVGALRALLEAGLRPDIMIGTSVGAMNATALAAYGVNEQGLERLVQAWRDAQQADWFPTHSRWTMMWSLLRRTQRVRQVRMREFLIAHGIAPGLRFGDLRDVRVGTVAADIRGQRMVVYGTDPDESVLEGVLASIALVPWLPPVETEHRVLIDGGSVSNLPVQVAMEWGAEEIIALDLSDDRLVGEDITSLTTIALRFMNIASYRQTELELALAAARGIPVTHIHLQSENPVLLWDFSQTERLIAEGYEIAKRVLSGRRGESVVESSFVCRQWARVRRWLCKAGSQAQTLNRNA